MRTTSQFLGKFAYAILFLLLLPAGLLLWAHYTEHLVQWPVIGSPAVAWGLLIGGGLLMLWGMLALMILGKGLPMNAYPPSVFVQKGPFRIVRHPIYWGFAILFTGVFMLLESASGIWLVMPITVLGMIALVWGYEKIDLEKRFPGQALSTILDLPAETIEKPAFMERLAALIRVTGLLLLGNFLTLTLAGHVSPSIGEPLAAFPVLKQPLLLVISFAFLLLIPFSIQTKTLLRQWVIASSIAVALAVYLALLVPSIGAQYLVTEAWALFSVPVFLLLLSAYALWQGSKLGGTLFGIVAVVLSMVQLSYNPSAALHLGVAIVLFLLTANYQAVWRFLRYLSEKVANSWQEWVFGKVRVINHGFYVGFGAFLGILLAGILAGPGYAWAILVFAITVIVFSALWAQIIEGSEKLKRPYGYYGAMVGIIFASLIVWAMGAEVWVVIGVISVVMPWVQAIGRLRCLINGCCHGDKIDNPNIGIRYFHHRSRVCNISHLKGELLHPTPLYAILWLILVGFVLLMLWVYHYSAPFIFGMYLILTGLGRFVEEAYRGEVQTPIIRGLRLYQWTALLSVLIGIFMTAIRVEPAFIDPVMNGEVILAAALGGLFTFIAMGVDLPYSNARFSRLV